MTYFSFSLEEFAREILDLISVLTHLQSLQRSLPPRSWHWLLFWSRHERLRRPSSFPQLPKPKPATGEPEQGKWQFRLWRWLERLRKPEIKFAVKVGVGAVFLAGPAFTEGWRGEYTHWRGEWALLSYFVVIASSVGATTSTGFWRYTPPSPQFVLRWAEDRILGTSIGAVAAICLYGFVGGCGLMVDGNCVRRMRMFCRLWEHSFRRDVSISLPIQQIGNPSDDSSS